VLVTDAAFEAWLAQLPARGYDRAWIGHNLPALRTRYESNPDAPMPECSAPAIKARDRYEEL